MLPRSQRLSVEQFNSVIEKGRVTHSPFFHMKHLVLNGKPRFSAVIPQKIAKKAVLRNKTRRKIYDSIKPLLPSVKEGIYAIVFAKSPALETSDMDQSIEELFVKAGVMK